MPDFDDFMILSGVHMFFLYVIILIDFLRFVRLLAKKIKGNFLIWVKDRVDGFFGMLIAIIVLDFL